MGAGAGSNLRHDVARRRAVARVLAPACPRSCCSPVSSMLLGVDIIEAGFPIASPADAEAVRRIATEIRRPVIACLARCHRADLEKAAWAIQAGRAGPHPHVHRHLGPAPEGEAAHDARAVPRGGGRVGPLRAAPHVRRRVLGRGRHAQRPRLPLPRRRGGDQGRRDDDQPARHRRLLDAGRDARVLPHASASACRTRTR